MKPITQEWVLAAQDDLSAAEVLMEADYLFNVVSFHCQQAVEKLLKALIEEHDINLPKTHSLDVLYGKVKPWVTIEDIDTLRRLNSLYIESRYPGELGLLPEGKPTLEDATIFLCFARDVYNRIANLIQ